MARDFDTSRFLSGVSRELSRVKLDARREVRETGEEAAMRAKSLAPRDSGAMADSITAEHGFDAQGPYSDVTVEPFYSTWVEFGSSRQAARPFIRPAVTAAIRRLRRKG